MKKSVWSPLVSMGALFGLVLAMIAGSAAVFGQATPEASGSVIHPAHIHAGMCPDVGDVVFPLGNVLPAGEGDLTGTPQATPSEATPSAEPMMTGTPASAMGMALESTTVVDASLDDILGAEHAINVHMSPDQLDVYIACGDITGEAQDGELVIEMQELNGSGVSGEATLTDNGDGTTTVSITLHQNDGDLQGTPGATPES